MPDSPPNGKHADGAKTPSATQPPWGGIKGGDVLRGWIADRLVRIEDDPGRNAVARVAALRLLAQIGGLMTPEAIDPDVPLTEIERRWAQRMRAAIAAEAIDQATG